MSTGLLPASVLPGLLEIALQGRLNVQDLFDRAGIDPDVVGRADCYITQTQLDTLLSTAFSEVSDPFFGIAVGRANHYTSLGLLGNLMATSDTLGMALQALLRYKDLLVPYLFFQLHDERENVSISVGTATALSFTALPVHDDTVLSTIVSIGRSLLGGDMGLCEVRFAHAEPADTRLYREFFRCPLVFDQPRNEVVLRADRLSEPLPTAYPRYHERLRDQAERQLSRLTRASGVSGQVRSLIRRRMGHGSLHIDDVAASLNVTARTLQRRLKAEHVSYAALRDEERRTLACRLLSSEECDMEQLARRLGFSDTANFYHAFRRWEGCPPGAWRRRHAGRPRD
jgi:AraC-like DNA-binding protein